MQEVEKRGPEGRGGRGGGKKEEGEGEERKKKERRRDRDSRCALNKTQSLHFAKGTSMHMAACAQNKIE